MTFIGAQFLTKNGIKMLPKRQSIEISALKNRGKLVKKERVNYRLRFSLLILDKM